MRTWHLILVHLLPLRSTVALRLDLSGDPSFAEALQRAKRMSTEAFAHGNTPFAKVVDALDITRSAAFTPVYQVQSIVCLANPHARYLKTEDLWT